MARTELTKVSAPGSYSYNSPSVGWEQADASNGNKFKASGTDLVLVKETAGTDDNITVVSVADKYGRTKDLTFTANNDTYILGPFDMHGWMQTDGYIYLDAASTDVSFAIIQWR